MTEEEKKNKMQPEETDIPREEAEKRFHRMLEASLEGFGAKQFVILGLKKDNGFFAISSARSFEETAVENFLLDIRMGLNRMSLLQKNTVEKKEEIKDEKDKS